MDSSGFMPAFESLSQLRDTQSSTARRQSHSDQQVKGNYLGQLFHNNFGRNIGK
ncbi:hypothetical protein GMORB2_7439 [Geosmithia morbida]|uniref:Uncharacterized protein n=1 Tax=Geosmithia morbida TaxID=1094350 RepID=A0A9P5D176_9HYPO|nr:uncharacterized protein GMORB2_7439 [Geosmithia morbida]KAF4122447.1 hypothetical protein GMORB2_7439 [Geosmithia morbida]